jgi:3-oxoacyl-[acyl-carrier protein] reductase
MLCPADVAVDADCRRLVETALKQWGRIDVLVNSAGTTKSVSHYNLEGRPADDFIRIFSVNTLGPFQMARAVAPHEGARRRSDRERLFDSGAARDGQLHCLQCLKAGLNVLTHNRSRASSLQRFASTPSVPDSFRDDG